jgi:hypothetical protein
MRREVFVALMAFVGGFVVILAVLGWLIVHFVIPEARWWDVLHTSVTAIMISVWWIVFSRTIRFGDEPVSLQARLLWLPFLRPVIERRWYPCDCPCAQVLKRL